MEALVLLTEVLMVLGQIMTDQITEVKQEEQNGQMVLLQDHTLVLALDMHTSHLH